MIPIHTEVLYVAKNANQTIRNEFINFQTSDLVNTFAYEM